MYNNQFITQFTTLLYKLMTIKSNKVRLLWIFASPWQQLSFLNVCEKTNNKATCNDDDDNDDGLLLAALWWMRIDVTSAELCVPACVFAYERRQTIPKAKQPGYHQTHINTQILMGRLTLQIPSSWSAVQPRALPESLSPARVQLPTSGLPYQRWPSLLIFVLPAPLSVSRTLINQCQAVQQQGRHSFGSLHMSLWPSLLPLRQVSGHHLPFTWPQNWNPGPLCQHERLFSERKGERWGGGISFSFGYFSFLFLCLLS